MPLILPGNVASATAPTAYSIDYSCRFNQDASLSKDATSASPTLATKSTISFWVKSCSHGVDPTQNICYTNAAVNPYFQFQYPGNTGAGPVIYLQNYSSSNTLIYTNQVIRDHSAWQHIVFAYDSTPSTPSASSMRLFVNGVQVTSLQTGTYGSQNIASSMTIASQEWLIGVNPTPANYFNGYLAEFMVVDGQALAATSFGEFDSDSPTIWKPIDISDITLGNQGFYLDFKDSANMGNDVGGGTDFTENSIDATDQATDTPTNNFCIMNSLDNYYQGHAFSQGNCKIITTASGQQYTVGTVGLTAGKWYWECEYDAISADADHVMIGIAGTPTTSSSEQELGEHVQNWSYYSYSGTSHNNATFTSYGDAYTEGDIVGIALDLDNNKLYFSKNGTFQNSGDPTSGATGTGAISITDPASVNYRCYFPAASDWTGSRFATFLYNFGGCSAFTVSSANQDGNGYGNFEYAVPSGYLAICTKNLGSDGG
jgi:hypothetical protein